MAPTLSKQEDTEQLSTKQLVGVIITLALAAFTMILNETVLTVALPDIMQDLDITAATGQWLTTGFLLTLSVVIPTTGFLLQRYSHRSLFHFAIISFLLGTLLATFAPNFALIFLARIIQAVGTAIILPLMMTTTLTLVPITKRGTVMGLNSIVIGVGPAIGPTASGAIVHSLGWHYVFALMLPIGLLVLVLGGIFFKVPSTARESKVDYASVVLSALAFGLLVYSISSVEKLSEQPVLTIGAFVIGAVSLVLFISRQISLARSGRELLNFTVFKNRNFSLAIVIIMIAFGTMLGTLMILPIILQTGRGFDALAIGLMLLPGGIVQSVVAPIFGRIYDKFGPRPVLIPGTALIAIGQWLYASVDAQAELTTFMMIHMVFSAGMAMLMTGLMTSAMSSVEPRYYGHGSAIFNTSQQLAGAIGTTVFVTVLMFAANLQLDSGAEVTAGYIAGAHTAFVIGGVLTTLTFVLSLFIKEPARSAEHR